MTLAPGFLAALLLQNCIESKMLPMQTFSLFMWSDLSLVVLLAPFPFSLTGVFHNKSLAHLMPSRCSLLGGPGQTPSLCGGAR